MKEIKETIQSEEFFLTPDPNRGLIVKHILWMLWVYLGLWWILIFMNAFGIVNVSDILIMSLGGLWGGVFTLCRNAIKK